MENTLRSFYLFVILASLLAGAFSALHAQAAPSKVLPEADALVSAGEPGVNTGTLPCLLTINICANTNYETLLRFPLTSITGNIKKVTLKMCALNFFGGVTQVYQLPDSADTLGETTITWNTRPTGGQSLGVLSATAPADVTLDVTSAVQTEMGAGRNKLLSLRLFGQQGQGNSYWSREKGVDYAPCLLIEYQ